MSVENVVELTKQGHNQLMLEYLPPLLLKLHIKKSLNKIKMNNKSKTVQSGRK